MSTFLFESPLSPALSIVVRATILLSVAAIGQAVMHRRSSAATRHLVWTLAIAAVLLLPIVSVALPQWVLVTNTAPTGVAEATPVADGGGPLLSSMPPAAEVAAGAGSMPVPAADRFSWPVVIAGVYAAGVLVMLIHLAMQRSIVRRLAREAADVRNPEWARLLSECTATMGLHRAVRLLRSRERSMPMAFGTRRPAVLIPAVAETWPEDRRRAVILHEVAHVARYDCLMQTLAFVACAVYWFHPAVWWVARRLRIERELACDDRVIAAGAQPREYAGHLLEIAYTFGNGRAPALAVDMARPRQLEGRLLAALDVARNRRTPALRLRLGLTVIATALLLPLATVTSTTVAVVADADAPAPQAPLPILQEHRVGPHLEEIPLRESIRLILRAAAAAMGVAQESLAGTWEIRPSGREGTVHLRIAERNSSSGSDVPIERLEGLAAAELTGAGGPAQFRLRRDAGTFTFEGVFRGGVGAGTFSFTPDPSFPAELAQRGFARPTALEQYQLARHDVGYAFVDELNTQAYAQPPISELVRAGQHGVSLAYLQGMGALGYRLGSLAPVIQLRDHGVTPVYVRELAEQGYKGLSADDLRRARDHGITPEYVRAMRDAGYGSLPIEQLIKARDHGISAEFVRELDAAGHRKLPLDQLIRVRDHGVSPEYAREMRQLGHAVPIDELVRARDHGVSVDFVRDMAALGYSGVPIDSLVRLRDHGVTPKYVQELQALGYDRLSLDDLVTLRDHGLTPERIRAANARAGTRLPVDMLKSFAAGGMR